LTERNYPKPVIAIFGGTGNEGPGLALRWAQAGYLVIIGSRQTEKAQTIADELNLKLGGGTIRGMQNNEAARHADICVLTVPSGAHQATVEGLKEDLKGKILVDATARVNFREPKPPHPPSAARMAQDTVGEEVSVVAAFQNIPAHTLRTNLDKPVTSDVLVCADDLEAADIVIHLAQEAGMRAYYAGNLDNAVVLEGLTCLLISLNKRYHVRSASISITGILTAENSP